MFKGLFISIWWSAQLSQEMGYFDFLLPQQEVGKDLLNVNGFVMGFYFYHV